MLSVRAKLRTGAGFPAGLGAKCTAWACWLLAAAACGGIAEESSAPNRDPFSTFEPQQPNGRRGGGRRRGGAPPAFGSEPAPAAGAGSSEARPRPSAAPPASPPAMGAAAAVDAGSSSCDAGSCAPLTCEPGAFRCSGSALELCVADFQSWVLQARCASSCLCELAVASGQCPAPGCVPGEVRCFAGQLQACNACRTGFDLIQDCGSAEACNELALSCDVGSEAEPAGEEPPAPGAETPGADAGVP